MPERDDRVVQKSMDEIKGIMKTLNTEMVCVACALDSAPPSGGFRWKVKGQRTM